MANNPLSMVGMALKAGRVVVGEEPCGIACREKKARLLLLASDAADNTRRRCDHFAQEGNCIMLTVPDTKAGLGAIVGRKSCAMVAVTEIGFAATIAKGLAAQDPAFQEVAEKMELKAKRAQERKTKEGPKKEKPAVPAPVPNGERRRDDLRSSAPQRKPYNRDGGRKSFNRDGDRKPYNRDGDRKPYVKRDDDGEQHPTSQRKSFRGARPVKKGKGSYRKKDNA